MKHSIWALFFFGALCSCNTTSKDEMGYVDYDWSKLETQLSNPVKIEIDTVADYFLEIHKYSNKIFVQGVNCNLYELEGDSLKFKTSYLKKGDGPREVQSSIEFSRMNDGRFVAIEGIGSQKIFVSHTSDIAELEDASTWNLSVRPKQESKFFFQRLQPINDTLLIGAIMGDCPSKFASCNLNTGEMVPLNYTYPAILDNLSDFEKSFAYEGFLYKKPDENKYVFTSYTGLYSFIFDCDGKKIENLRHIFNKPAAYESRGNGKRPGLVDGKSEYVCSSPHVTERNLYYSSRRATAEDVFKLDTKFDGYPCYYTKEILVFDWEGKPYKKYVLDKPIHNFFVDESASMLYGLSSDSPDSEEEYIVGYKM